MCGNCFKKQKIECKTYNCPKCGIIIDRDVNGARNIYIKYIGDVLEYMKMENDKNIS